MGLSLGREPDITVLEDIDTGYGNQPAPCSVVSGPPLQVKAGGT